MRDYLDGLVLKIDEKLFFLLSPLTGFLFFLFFLPTIFCKESPFCLLFMDVFAYFVIVLYGYAFFVFYYLYLRKSSSRFFRFIAGSALLVDAVLIVISVKFSVDNLDTWYEHLSSDRGLLLSATLFKEFLLAAGNMGSFGIAAVGAGVVVYSFFEPGEPKANLAKFISFDSSMMWVELQDGRCLGVPLTYFPRLLHAVPEARMDYIISDDGKALHWDALDEDISVEGLLQGVGDRTSAPRRSAA